MSILVTENKEHISASVKLAQDGGSPKKIENVLKLLITKSLWLLVIEGKWCNYKYALLI